MHYYVEATWQATTWRKNHFRTNKTVLFQDFTAAVVGL
jgi:hypothetical protein